MSDTGDPGTVPYEPYQPIWVENKASIWIAATLYETCPGGKSGWVRSNYGLHHQSKVCDDVELSDAPALLELVQKPGLERTRALSSIRFLISQQHTVNRVPMAFEYGMIPIIIKVIREGSEEDKLAACWIIRHGGRGDISILDRIFKEGAIPAVVPLLSPKNQNEKLHSIAVQCVTAITYSANNKKWTIRMGVLPPLADSLRENWNAADVFIALSNMAGDDDNSESITNHGIFDMIDIDSAAEDDKLLMNCMKMISSLVAGFHPASAKTVQKQEILEMAIQVVQRVNCQLWIPESLESWALTLIQRIALFEFARKPLLDMGAIAILSEMMIGSCYQSMKAAMAVAILIGRTDEARTRAVLHHKKVQPFPRLVELLKNVVEGKNGPGYSAGIFSLLEVTTVFRNLTTPENMPKLIQAGVPQYLVRILQEKREPLAAIELTAATLLDIARFEEPTERLGKKQKNQHPNYTPSKLVQNIPELVVTLKKWLRNKEISSQLQDDLSQLLWVFDTKHSLGGDNGYLEESKQEEKHIFISYSWAHQEIVLKMTNKLKKSGLKVWFDQDCKEPQYMVEGLTSCAVMLVDASPQYKESARCCKEGQYALQLGLPVIPLVTEPKYKANGWLNLLLGDSERFGFYEGCDFNESFRGVLGALEPYFGKMEKFRDSLKDLDPL